MAKSNIAAVDLSYDPLSVSAELRDTIKGACAQKANSDVIAHHHLIEQYFIFIEFLQRIARAAGVTLPGNMPRVDHMIAAVARQSQFFADTLQAGFRRPLVVPRLSLVEWEKLLELVGEMRFRGFSVDDVPGLHLREEDLGYLLAANDTHSFAKADHFPEWSVVLCQDNPGVALTHNFVPVTSAGSAPAVALAHEGRDSARPMYLSEAFVVFLTLLSSNVSVREMRREIAALGVQNFSNTPGSTFARYLTVRADTGDGISMPTLYVEGIPSHAQLVRKSVARVVRVL